MSYPEFDTAGETLGRGEWCPGPCDYDRNGPSLRPEIEVTLLRAAQEALTNAHKHASPSKVVLTLSYMDGVVVLDVQDNGAGFDTTRLFLSLVEQPAGGFGLKALRERVAQQGGTLSIESTCGEGTTIAVALPAAGNKPPSLQEASKEVV